MMNHEAIVRFSLINSLNFYCDVMFCMFFFSIETVDMSFILLFFFAKIKHASKIGARHVGQQSTQYMGSVDCYVDE